MSLAAILTHSRLKLFLALSRTPHGIIDIATPALAALLCLGHFPSLVTILLGLVTVFAGYTAVYALNDLVDYRTDREKVRAGGYGDGEDYLDGVLVRHPLAKGVLTLPEGILWAGGWALAAMIGAWLLNPVCFAIFLVGGLLEAIYCLLWRVTPLRALVNGIVKTLGAVAAVYAVNPQPSIIFLIVLFCWIFFWEIGGQNIPNDWTDIEEDCRFKAKTIPVKLGLARAGMLAMACLVVAFFFTFLLLWISPLTFGFIHLLAVAGFGAWLLLLPALRLVEANDRQQAMDLFNKASHFPLSVFVIVFIRLVIF
ncbi:MAG: UbiA family prenyltransferase [Desulfosarcina sp.]|nr:UbiA family prenyltransferase [Desulfosarcina sp.]MBC2743003.1 UbiA family prenyltransferase [Desulfosarcina sp.]MBC2765913.1 UbiA family prenyltransferase [Desulfosarcina sp.]